MQLCLQVHVPCLLTRGRIHPASIWIPLLSIVWFVVLNAVVAPSALGIKVGSWLLK